MKTLREYEEYFDKKESYSTWVEQTDSSGYWGVREGTPLLIIEKSGQSWPTMFIFKRNGRMVFYVSHSRADGDDVEFDTLEGALSYFEMML